MSRLLHPSKSEENEDKRNRRAPKGVFLKVAAETLKCSQVPHVGEVDVVLARSSRDFFAEFTVVSDSKFDQPTVTLTDLIVCLGRSERTAGVFVQALMS